jgi:predicted transcriptional regulator
MQHKEHLNKLKGLVSNNLQWDNFEKYIDTLIDQQHRLMEQSDNIVSMHRAQGAVYQLRRLKLLRDEVLKNG